MSRKSWIQINGKLIPKEDYHGDNSRAAHGLMVIGDIEPFVSPVDGKPVMSRKQLREHNKLHDVHNYADYSPEYFEKRAREREIISQGQTKADKEHRIALIKQALEKY